MENDSARIEDLVVAEAADASASPVTIGLPIRGRRVQSGIALCLSGGGYRAIVFHLGSLWRLNEAGYLPKLDRVSSVSGGSITAGVLALNWKGLDFRNGVAANFDAAVVQPLRTLAGKSIDATAVLGGVFGPGSVSDRVRDAYNRYLFHHKTLQDITSRPRFVFNATNVQSGVLWRFMKPYMRDYRVGEVKNPRVELAVAVAASSAFPPVLSPVHLDLEPSDFTPNTGLDLQREPYTSDAYLTDGGVYDNLGLETAWKRYRMILVSDAGGRMDPQEEPKFDWVRHSARILEIIDNQVRSLRKRQVIAAYVRGDKTGAYWGIRTDIGNYGLPDHLPAPFEETLELARTETRLRRLDATRQERLINWGYAVTDAALRRHVDAGIPVGAFPFPDTGV